jgi:hypothetical protein
MDSNINENYSVITKTDKTGLVWLLRFTKNQSVTIQILRKYKKPEKSSDKPEKPSDKSEKPVDLSFLSFKI